MILGKSCDKSQQIMAEEMLQWFDRWLKGIKPERFGKPIRMFSVGKNIWEEAEVFPLPDAKEAVLYLGSDGHANTKVW